jgi:hypothetical protein
MKSRKYPSFQDAITYLESKGELKYWGRIGLKYEICLYSYIIDGVKYTLNITDDGKVEIRE